MAITVTDQFCGAGGSSLGAVAAGFELRLGLNHWQRAIETHAANFPDADHACVDVAGTDPSWFPKTDVLITSPSCTAHSYARGRPKDDPHVWNPRTIADQRSRATMWSVCEWAEYHDYSIVIVENVVPVLDWGSRDNPGSQFRAWLQAMEGLGYEHELCFLNSQFFPPTPQSRDRIYIVFWKRGLRAPDLEFTPVGYCPACDELVHGCQTWKKPERPRGAYGQQYVYTCPICSGRVVPATTPAATAIDWGLEAPRIADRARPLKPATMARIGRGLERLGERPLIVAVGGNLFERPGYARAWPTDAQAMPTLTTVSDRGLVVPVRNGGAVHSLRARQLDEPLPTQTGRQELGLATFPDEAICIDLRGHNRPRDPDEEPLSTVCASGNHHGLIVSNYGLSRARQQRTGNPGGWARRAELEPLGTITTTDGHALVDIPEGMVIAYNRTAVGRDVTEPLPTVTTVDPHALVRPELRVEDCGFRMLQPEEIARAMVMDTHVDGSPYKVTGTKRDRVKQLGNAVTPPVMQALLERCAESLEQAA